MGYSVLCWLATADSNNAPNVSPKEVFTFWGDDKIIIANIASPGSVNNILTNASVCVSFIDVLVQKGFKAKGKADILEEHHSGYDEMKAALEQLTLGKYPFRKIILVDVKHVEPIIAPSYRLFPEMTEQERVEQAKRQYGLDLPSTPNE